MKQLICELCDSTNLVKQDGFFICQDCGTKYSLEEAKKMLMAGGNVETRATVETRAAAPIDNNALIDNYLSMAKHAADSSNNEEAENYANKIIEMDPCHSEAWEIKGSSAGWQSTIRNNRMAEAVSAWSNAIHFATEEDKAEVKGRVAGAYCDLFLAFLSLHTDNFGNIQDANHFMSIKNMIDSGISMMNDLTVQCQVYFNRAPVYDQIARKLNSCAVAGYKDAKKDFGPEHRNMAKWQWERFTESCDKCLEVLNLAIDYVRDTALGKTICDNYVTIGEDARDSRSWKFDVNSWTSDHYVTDFSFTSSAKGLRTVAIDRAKRRKKFFEKSPADVITDKLSDDDNNMETKLGIAAYWATHQFERESLESEKKTLEFNINTLNQKMESLPILNQITETEGKIESLNTEKNQLGLFKFKDKKALQEKIDEQNVILSQLNSVADDQKESIQSEISKHEDRIEEIKTELTKSRGTVNTEGMLVLKDMIANGKFQLSPEQFVAQLSDKLPSGYFVLGELKKSFCDLYRSSGNCWSIDMRCGVITPLRVRLIMQAESTTDPIQSIIVESHNIREPLVDWNIDKITEWCRISATIIMSLFDEISYRTADIVAANLLFDDEQSRYFQDGFCIEYVTYNKYRAMLIR